MRPALWHRVLFSAWTRPVLLILILLRRAGDLAIRLFGIKPYLIPGTGSGGPPIDRRMAEAMAREPGHDLRNAWWLRAVDPVRHSDGVDDRLFADGGKLRLSAPRFFAERSQDRHRASFCRLVRLRHHSQGHLRVHARILPGGRVDRRRFNRSSRHARSRALDEGLEAATFMRISLPQAMPSLFAGLKVSVTLAVVGAVVGEFVGSNSGIGYLLQIANGNFDLPLMFAALTVLSRIGVLLFVAVDVVERLMIPWHASHRNDFTATA
jgi:hypothetical protein